VMPIREGRDVATGEAPPPHLCGEGGGGGKTSREGGISPILLASTIHKSFILLNLSWPLIFSEKKVDLLAKGSYYGVGIVNRLHLKGL